MKLEVTSRRVTGGDDLGVTVLTVSSHPSDHGPPKLLQKQYRLDQSGKIEKIDFQQVTFFDSEFVPARSIFDLAKLLERVSTNPNQVLIRGINAGSKTRRVRRQKEVFPEHSEGTPFVMLDFDNVTLPAGQDPLSTDAIDYVLEKLPAEFAGVSYFYQHSNSAGIESVNGEPLKSGLNAHVFFWLSRRIPGVHLAAYLKSHCLATDFYQIESSTGVRIRYGIDPSVIVNSVQPHYTARPDIGPGIVCRLSPKTRQGLVKRRRDEVVLPDLATDLVQQVSRQACRVTDTFKRQHGYKPSYLQTRTEAGFATIRTYTNASSNVTNHREFLGGRLSADGKIFTLEFADESSKGSWYVVAGQSAHIARHHGGDRVALRELSEPAYTYVRNDLKWITDVPSHDLDLDDEGFLPPLESFAKARVSLILAPTGSGKTTALKSWIFSKLEDSRLVVYSAPTIALVNQTLHDLRSAGLPVRLYGDVRGKDDLLPVIVTTNASLDRILKLASAELMPYHLIVDEIHAGLDEFMKSNLANQTFEAAMSKARQTLLLTGTLTTVQRNKVADVVGHSLGSLTEADFCRYEFASRKQNPLVVRPSSRFDADFIELIRDLKAKVEAKQPLPRVVLLLPLSKLNAYRAALEGYGLTDKSHVVSRPESTAEEIEEARTSTSPILIASPLFAVGLNFERQPDILWCSFSHVKADTNQITQTVNRANRGSVQCDVRIYGNPDPDARFSLGNLESIKKDVDARLRAESTLQGALEKHLHVDRAAYLLLRDSEKDSHAALSDLVINGEIQNYVVVDEEFLPGESKDLKDVLVQLRADAKAGYQTAIQTQAARFGDSEIYQSLWRLQQLHKARRENHLLGSPRLDIEMTQEEQGLIMALCGLESTAGISDIKVAKLLKLFAETSPWMSAQYDRSTFSQWAKVEASKVSDIAFLAIVLERLRSEQLTTGAVSNMLTGNSRFRGALLALAGNDVDFVEIGRKIDELKSRRLEVRARGSNRRRAEVQAFGLQLLGELLAPLGIRYELLPKPGEVERVAKVDQSSGRRAKMKMTTNFDKLIVPGHWNLMGMAEVLSRRSQSLIALPNDQRVPLLDDVKSLGEQPMSLQVCSRCVHLHNMACAVGRQVDWQGEGSLGSEEVSCEQFKLVKLPGGKV